MNLNARTTAALVEGIRAGTYRITEYGSVWRKTRDGTWTGMARWRRNVVTRAWLKTNPK